MLFIKLSCEYPPKRRGNFLQRRGDNKGSSYGTRAVRCLVPRIYEGARRAGGVRIPGSRAKSRIVYLYFIVQIFILISFYVRHVIDGLPPSPVCALVTPPSQVRGGKAAYRVSPRTMKRYQSVGNGPIPNGSGKGRQHI